MTDIKFFEPPPYSTGETNVRRLYQHVVELDEWSVQLWAKLPAEIQQRIDANSQRTIPGEPELLQAVSVWQLYRTIRAIRAIRIGWDWILRELDPNHPERDMHLAKSVIAARATVGFAFTTAAEFRAYRSRQVAVFSNFMQNFFGPNEGGDGKQSQS